MDRTTNARKDDVLTSTTHMGGITGTTENFEMGLPEVPNPEYPEEYAFESKNSGHKTLLT